MKKDQQLMAMVTVAFSLGFDELSWADIELKKN